MLRASLPAAPARHALWPVVLLLTACGGIEHEPQQPPEAFAETKQTGGSAPAPGEVPSGAPAPERSISEVMVDCERHIRAWQYARAQASSQRELEQLDALQEAVGMYVIREMEMVRETALIGEPRLRGVASTALGFSKDPSVLPILLNNLGAEHPEVVANALFGLGMLAAPETPGRALQEVIDRPNTTLEMIQNGAFAAAMIAQARSRDTVRGQRDDGLRETLLTLLDRPEPGIRAQAASGLGWAVATEAVPLLANLLAGDAEARVRFAAAFALGEIGASDGGAVLVAALDDPDRMVAGAARGALAKLYGRDYGPDPLAWEPLLRD